MQGVCPIVPYQECDKDLLKCNDFNKKKHCAEVQIYVFNPYSELFFIHLYNERSCSCSSNNM